MILVKDTLKLECLVQALEEYTDAKREHDTERDRYAEGGGYSWGYHGQRLVARKEDAAANFGERLNALIAERVSLALLEIAANEGGPNA